MAGKIGRAAVNGLIAAATVALGLVGFELAARALHADIGTTGQSGTYLSRQWYASNPARANSLGFREREVSTRAANDGYRVAAVGDSFTFGPGIPEAARVSNRLAQMFHDAGETWLDVVNFGRSGANYEENESHIRLAIEQARPNFILLQWYLNDLDDPEDPLPRPAPLAGPLHKSLQAVSVLYFLANQAWATAQIKWGAVDADAYYARFLDPDDPIAVRGRRRFDAMLRAATDADVPVAVFLWPELTRPVGASPNDPVLDAVLEACARRAVACIDLRPALREVEDHSRLIVNRFDTHASAEANDIAAQVLHRALADRWRAAAFDPS